MSGRCSGLHWPGSNYRSWGRTCSWAQQVPASGEPVKPQAHSLPDSFSFTRGDSTQSLQKRKRKSGIMERSKEHQNFSNNFCQNNLFPFFLSRDHSATPHTFTYTQATEPCWNSAPVLKVRYLSIRRTDAHACA